MLSAIKNNYNNGMCCCNSRNVRNGCHRCGSHCCIVRIRNVLVVVFVVVIDVALIVRCMYGQVCVYVCDAAVSHMPKTCAFHVNIRINFISGIFCILTYCPCLCAECKASHLVWSWVVVNRYLVGAAVSTSHPLRSEHSSTATLRTAVQAAVLTGSSSGMRRI